MSTIEPALRLWQLISPALPVGAYGHSQGLETAVERGWVRDEASTLEWIAGQLEHGAAALEVPIGLRVHRAWRAGDDDALRYWNARLIAARETAELRAEERRLGAALWRLLPQLDVPVTLDFAPETPSFLVAFMAAAAHWGVPERTAACGHAWSVCENLVTAAIKLVPLGQSAGQRLLFALGGRIPQAVESGAALADDDIGRSNPRQALASAWHERQYTRLFLS
ncbi:MAG: urease accessory protein UreF [Gammaproteobacteria bacterium]|nr:MAG: urease accessory protein UreF [Gammaproteobacteria bacterium]